MVTWVGEDPGVSMNIEPYKHGYLMYGGSFHVPVQDAAFF